MKYVIAIILLVTLFLGSVEYSYANLGPVSPDATAESW